MNDHENDDPDEDAETEILDVTGVAREPYRISRAAVVLIALALGLGLLIGRASVKSDPSAAPASPAPTSGSVASPSAFGPHALMTTGAKCSEQKGDELVLGVEVRNTTNSPLILKELDIGLPMGGMTVLSRGVGSCGELDVPNLADYGLAPDGAVWLSVTTRPTPKCPAPLPVLMTLDVTNTAGQKASIDVGGFNDLGAIPWSGCPSSSP